MLRAFLKLGWAKVRQAGSHVVIAKPGRTPVTIPVHPGTLKLGTAKAILKQTEVSEDDFFDTY
jgi:predicted RNA binding protein YcfA (HicA-like mRNA interferase family)